MIYARSSVVESNPRYQAAVAEQRRREQAQIEARRKAEQLASSPILAAEELAEQRRERDRRMFEEAARKFPFVAEIEPETIIEAVAEPVIPKITISEIINEVAAKHRISAKELLGRNRRRHVIEARFEAIHRVWIEKAPISMSEIGRKFGGLDHTTILNALRRGGLK